MPVAQTKKPRSDQPAFLITIDTEGDNLWASPRPITTENSRYLPRFQSLCETYGFKPTWLTNYEMAQCPVFCEFGRRVVAAGTGEIGMHLHAWNSPPLAPLTENDMIHHPYLIEYPEHVMRQKIRRMTDLLEDRFQRKMVSHRSGRWAFDRNYARLLVEHGYLVDCSVTPHRNWADHPGDPRGSGGTDFTGFPDEPYFIDLERIDRAGNSPLLEVPVSIMKRKCAALSRIASRGPSLVRLGVTWLFRPILWLRPNGRNLNWLLWILRQSRRQRRPCVEFMLHSSELMPGGSPTFRTRDRVERLYDHLEALFSTAADSFQGKTLEEFRASYGSVETDPLQEVACRARAA